MIPVYRPRFSGEELQLVTQAVSEGWISSRGKYVHLFETRFKEYVNSSTAAAVSNGTTALQLAIACLKCDQRKRLQVILPDLSYVAAANAVLSAGLIPVSCDVDPTTGQMTLETVKKVWSSSIAGIVVVHNYGGVAEVDAISDFAKESGVWVVEDCAEALGGTLHGRHVGTFGDIGTFSFFANKAITTGEGGMVISMRDETGDRLKKLRSHSVVEGKEYYHDEVGFNYRMTNLQAAIGYAQMAILEKNQDSKRTIFAMYRHYLEGIVNFLGDTKDSVNACWMMTVLVDAPLVVPLRGFLSDKGVETRRGFTPLSQMPHTRNAIGSKLGGTCLNAQLIASKIINLPSFPDLTERQVAYICAQIKKFFEKNITDK